MFTASDIRLTLRGSWV